MKTRARFLFAIALASGCVSVNDAFTCSDDAACIRDGEAGLCASGHCIFSDPTCTTSGYRYDEHSGRLGGTCAPCGDSPEDSLCPAGDRPTNPVRLGLRGPVGSNLRYAHDDAAICGSKGAPDVFFEFQLDASGVIYANSLGTNT